MMQPKIIVIIPCAGRGSRFVSDIPKQYHKIGSQTVLEHTYCKNYANLNSKISILQVESDSRAMSVKKALEQIQLEDQDWVLVHDAVRCCISQQAIIRLITQLYDDAVGGILAIPVTDTLKTTDNNQQIITTLDRSLIYLAQTPQMFRYAILKQALLNCDLNKITDESSSVELLGYASKIILGEVSNIKITTPGDLEIAQFFLEHKNCK